MVHKYIKTQETYTFGARYVCQVCGRKLYLPYEWRLRINPQIIRGCKGDMNKRAMDSLATIIVILMMGWFLVGLVIGYFIGHN